MKEQSSFRKRVKYLAGELCVVAAGEFSDLRCKVVRVTLLSTVKLPLS